MSKIKKYQTEGVLDYDVWNEQFNQEFGGQVAPTAELSTVPQPFTSSSTNLLDTVIESSGDIGTFQRQSNEFSPLHGTYIRTDEFHLYPMTQMICVRIINLLVKKHYMEQLN